MSRLFFAKAVRKASSALMVAVMIFALLAQGMISFAANASITGVLLNETRTVITLKLSEMVTVASGVTIKNRISLSRDGNSAAIISSDSTVSVNGNTVSIALTSPLTSAANYVVIGSGAFEGQSSDITSPTFNAEGPKLAGDGVTIDDSKRTVTIKFAEPFVAYPSDESLKNGYITLARGGSVFNEVIPAGNISIDGANSRITLTLGTPLTGTNSRFRIAVGKIKSVSTGNINLDDITTQAISADFDKAPPQPEYSTISLSTDNRTVSVGFDENIYNVFATGVSASAGLEILKSHIWIDSNGAGYRTLGGQDTVSINGKVIVVRLANALTGANNTMKIDGGSLRDYAGNILFTNTETGRLVAGGGGGTNPDNPGAPVYNDNTGSYISSDMRTVTFTFDRNIMKNPSISESQMRAQISVNRNNGGYNLLGPYDTVSISGGRLTIVLNSQFSDNNNSIKISANTIASAGGDLLTRDIYSIRFNENGGGITGNAPAYNSVTYSPQSRQIRVKFNTNIYAVNPNSLKSDIALSRNNGSYNSLSSYDTAEIYNSNTILITLESPLTGSGNRIRVSAGAVKNSYGAIQYYDQTTDYIEAGGTSTGDDFKATFSTSTDKMTAIITFDRNIFSNFPYDNDYASLKQAITISRNSGMAYSSLTSYDNVSISGRTLRITLQKAVGSSDIIRIGRNALKDSYGTVLAYETKVGQSIDSGSTVFDPDTGAELSTDMYTLTLTFKQRVYNNMSSISSLKSMIRVSYDGSQYESLNGNDSVSLQSYGEMTITLSRTLSNPLARVKIQAGALQDESGKTVDYDIITNPLGQTSSDTEVLLGGSRVYFSDVTTSPDSSGNKFFTVAIKTTAATSEIGVKPVNTPLYITMPSIAYGGKVTMNGSILKMLKDKKSLITVKVGSVSHVLPAAYIDIEGAMKEMGVANGLVQNVTVEIAVNRVETPYTTKLNDKAAAKGFSVIAQPTEFTITFKTAAKTMAVTKYAQFIEKQFDIKPSQAQNKNLTIVRVETSGKVNPVPTKTLMLGGDYYLSGKTRNNGVYAAISGNRAFSDTPDWATTAVDCLASRMILQEVNGTAFRASDAVSRAEVAEMVTRSMGILTDKSGASKFFDVTLTDWYYPSVSVAAEYGLIRGYGDNTFKPGNSITRQEIMSIMARTIRFIKGEAVDAKPSMTAAKAEQILQKFNDSAKVAEWAKIDMAECAQAGIVNGDEIGNVNPNDRLTRAQMSQLIYNLLCKYELISQ